MSDTRTIHSKRMAGWLLYRGHKLIKITNDKSRPHFRVFIFADSESLQKDMQEYR